MENNNKGAELTRLLKEKKYEEAVDLVLGKEGSENDISGTKTFGVLSAIGREGLLELFEKGNFFGPPGQGKLAELKKYSAQFNIIEDMVINERILSGDFKLPPAVDLSIALRDRFNVKLYAVPLEELSVSKGALLDELLKNKSYPEAVDLVLGKAGSQDDISGSKKLGVISAIGRDNLLKLFQSGLSYEQAVNDTLKGQLVQKIQGIPPKEEIENRANDSKIGSKIEWKYKLSELLKNPSAQEEFSKILENPIKEEDLFFGLPKKLEEKIKIVPPDLPIPSITQEQLNKTLEGMSEEDRKKPIILTEESIADKLAKLRGQDNAEKTKDNKPK